MDYKVFYEVMLDNITDGIYILDDSGNYVYANSAYIDGLGINKNTLLSMNVHDFLESGQINFCISDIVYREKHKVVMYQDVVMPRQAERESFRQIVVSSPIFGKDGQIQNILAVCRPLDINDAFIREADAHEVAFFSNIAHTRDVDGSSIIAESHAMQKVLRSAEEVANIDATVLITGESGTGKEVIAQYIHEMGRKSTGEMISLSCAALPESLLESELFGYEKGSFTGASPAGKAGLFEMAAGGTLFLDEINSLPMALQGKLLRAVETKTIQRIGSTKSKKIDFRLIVATNEDLLELVESKRFRADLYYRINVVPIELPPLRERREDILPLTMLFLRQYNEKYDKKKQMTHRACRFIHDYDWPGNVRELKYFVERAVIMSVSDQIDILDFESLDMRRYRWQPSEKPKWEQESELLPVEEECLERGISLQEYLDRCERQYIDHALQRYKSTYITAQKLGTSQSSIMRRKKKYGL